MRAMVFMAWIAWTTAIAAAAEIRILAGSGVQPVMTKIVPRFELESGDRVIFDYGTVGDMAERARRGERAELAIVSGPQMSALDKDGTVVAGSRLDIGKTGIGVFVRKGAPKPDISSADAFKRAMLQAKSIGYNDPAAGAPVGIYLLKLFERLGIADRMTAKTVVFKQRSERFQAVARGDVEIGFNQVSEIVAQPAVDLVGSLPESIQNETLFSIGTLRTAEAPQAASAFLDYLSRPEIRAAFRNGGFDAP